MSCYLHLESVKATTYICFKSNIYEDKAFLQDLLDRCVGVIVVVVVCDIVVVINDIVAVIADVRTVAMVVASFSFGFEATNFSSRERVTIKIVKTISREIQTITARWFCHHLCLPLVSTISALLSSLLCILCSSQNLNSK